MVFRQKQATIAIDKCMAYRAADELSMVNVKEDENRLIFRIEKAQKGWFFDYIFSYGPYAEILEPQEVREEFIKRVKSLYNKYGICE